MSKNQLAADDAGDPPEPVVTDPPTDPPADPPKRADESEPKQPWPDSAVKRITEVSAAKNEAIAAAQAAEKRARDAEELLARLQAGDKGAGGDGKPPVIPTPSPQPRQPSHEQYQADVQREAARMRLWEDTSAIKAAGIAQFPDFLASVQILAAAEATNDEFILDVIAVDRGNAHVILDKLAKDPERAAVLAKMDSRRRIAELTKMTIADNKPTPKPAADPPAPKPAKVSNAPAPKPSIEPSAPASADDWMDPDKLDRMSEAEANAVFSRNWNKKYLGHETTR